jgi:crotonobetainyl-CoA:carnitine CoA-transferase CaiB-like acyl-CoA transferase
MGRVLEGLTVVEFSSNLAAAYTAMLLADHGTHVIKVEKSGTPALPGRHLFDRGKHRVAIDPELDDASDRVRRLVEIADIVVTGAGPAELAARGLDYCSIRAVNPAAIAVYLPPFGMRGELADMDAGEDLVAALTGITASQWALSGNPVATTFPVVGYATAVLGAIGAVSALIARESGAGGQSVEVPMIAGGLALQTGGALRHPEMKSLYPGTGALNPLGPIPCYRLFEAADGRYLFVACGNPTFWARFAILIDRPGLISDERFEDAPWGVSTRNREALRMILEPIMKTRPRDEWLEMLRAADVPAAPVVSREDFFDSPQVRYLGMRCEIDDPILGNTVQMGVPVRLAETPGEVRGPAAASLDEFNNVLAQVGRNAGPPESADVRAAGRAPLDGVRVLDFSSYIAGSFCGMLLAQLGADVIKVESLGGDSFRSMEFAFMGWNQGKRSLALDLGTADGRAIARELAAISDIVLENMRPGRMARFGLDYASLSELNPRIIYTSISGYGARGPEYLQPGFDPLLQARSGMMAAQGGHGGPPVYVTCSPCDYGAAMLATYASVLAIFSRRRTGRGQLCETSLLHAAVAFQAGELMFYGGCPDSEAGSAEYRGPSALTRVYRCAGNEWLCMDASDPRAWSRLCSVFKLDGCDYNAACRERFGGPITSRLDEIIGASNRATLIATLARAGIPAVVVNRVGDLFDDPQMAANGMFADLIHPKRKAVTQAGVLIKFSTTPGVLRRSAPLLGEHCGDILLELTGRDPAVVRELAARGVTRS